jgi:hypothetical protein
MKNLLLKFLFFLYRKDYYKPLSKIEIDNLLIRLATTKGLENLPAYLEQCSTNARNQFLYSQDEIFKGVILGFTTLREQIIQNVPKAKKKLTQEEEIGIMRKRGY